MTTIKEIFEQYTPHYIHRFKDRMPENHMKVIKSIIQCRTPESGTAVFACHDCKKIHTIWCSCGNRHCPTCHYQKSQNWLQKRLEKALPGHHFMITFTVPKELRDFIRSHPRKSYTAMFAASSQTLKSFARDERWAGGDLPGFMGILHTWGRQLPYHPHIHYIVPGGALSKEDGRWHPTQRAYFAPVKALSKVYRAKMADEMKKAGLYDAIDPTVWEKLFIVHSQPVKSGNSSLKYLTPYVFRVAISNSRIIKVENDIVFFRYKKPKSNRWRVMQLSAMAFIHRFLQHVLPNGFMKIRYYGFMGSGASIKPDELCSLVEEAFHFKIKKSNVPKIETAKIPICSKCKGALKFKYFMPPIGYNEVSDYG